MARDKFVDGKPLWPSGT